MSSWIILLYFCVYALYTGHPSNEYNNDERPTIKLRKTRTNWNQPPQLQVYAAAIPKEGETLTEDDMKTFMKEKVAAFKVFFLFVRLCDITIFPFIDGVICASWPPLTHTHRSRAAFSLSILFRKLLLERFSAELSQLILRKSSTQNTNWTENIGESLEREVREGEGSLERDKRW